jgi:hypothetical protein
MTKYTITGFHFFEDFTTEARARARFEEVKNRFTYCELKKVIDTDTYYRAESIEVFTK